MIRRPDWVKKEVPVQRTVLRRIPAPQQQQQQYGYPQMPSPSMQQPAPTFTGYGADGALQPGKRVGDVHEGEMVFDANTAQAIPPDVFQTLQQQAAGGNLDVNALRNALGMQPMAGFQTGTPRARGLPSEDAAPTVAPQQTVEPISDTYTGRPNPRTEGTINRTTQTPVQTTAPSRTVETASPTLQTIAPSRTVETASPTLNLPPVQQQTVKAVVRPPENASVPTLKLPPQQPTETTDSTTTQLSSFAKDTVQAGLQNLVNQMNGMSESDKRIANFYLTNTDSNNAANIQVLANRISADPSMSEAGKMMAIAGLTRDASSARATVSQGLAQNAQSRSDQATSDAMTAGQNIRNYEDVTLPTSLQQNDINKKTFEQVTLPTSQLNQESIRRGMATQADSDIQNRISTLFASGSQSTAQNDQTLRALVASRLGVNATPEQINAEIATQWSAFNESKKSDMVSNAEILIGYAIDNNGDKASVVSDDSIRRMVAAANGLDVNVETDKAKIDEAIGNLYDQVGKSDVDVVYENVLDSGMFDRYEDNTPDFKSDLRSAVADLLAGGYIDENGLPTGKGFVEWPWEAPSTYFKYNDWNGNEVTAGTNVGSDQITLTGNGSLYKNSNGQAVTNADAMAKWNPLSSSEKLAYFDNETGGPNIEKFLREQFPAVTREDGSTGPLTTPEQYDDQIFGSTEFAEQMGKLEKSFVSQSLIPDELTGEGSEYYGIEEVPDWGYLYYDENGNPKIGNKEGGNLGYIWQQLSDKYGKPPGTLLTTTQFINAWEEGKPWRVKENGIISNIESKGKTENLDEAINNIKQISSSTLGWAASIGQPPEGYAQVVSANYDNLPKELKSSGTNNYLESIQITTRYTVGADRWGLTDDAINWATQNKGKLYKAKSGRIYVVGGTVNPGKDLGNRNKTGYIVLYDYETGQYVKYSTDPGGGEERLLTGASYA